MDLYNMYNVYISLIDFVLKPSDFAAQTFESRSKIETSSLAIEANAHAMHSSDW